MIKAFGILLLPFGLYLVSVCLIELQIPVCLFKNIFGVNCWGCGLTRAAVSVIQLDFKGAVEYNWRILIVFPLFCGIWVHCLYLNILNFKKGVLLCRKRNN